MQLMLGLGLSLGLLGIFGVSGTMHLDQPVHANLTQNATVLCTKNGTTYCLMFHLWAHYDNIDLVFSRNNTHPHINSVGSFDSNGNGIIVDNSTGYLWFWFSIYWTYIQGAPPILTPKAMDALAYFIPNDVLAVDVMAKWRYASPFYDMVTFPLDVLWRVSCNCSEIEDNVIGTGEINVIGNVDEDPVRVVPGARLAVFLDLLNLESTTFSLGDPVFLEVLIVPQVGVSVVPTGVFVYSCYVCDVVDCSGMKELIMKTNGCSNVPYYIDPFRLIAGWTRTNTFQIFQLVGQEQMFFQCSVGFCYDLSDLRCIDYCDYNSSGKKRKRRQAEDEEEEDIVVTHTITIKRGPTARPVDGPFVTDATSAAVEQPETVGLIAAVVTLAGLLLVGLIVAVAVFFRLSRHNRVHEKSKN